MENEQRPTTHRVAIAINTFFGIWTLAGPAGLWAAIHERADSQHGSGWFQLGAFVFQAPCALALILSALIISVGRPRFARCTRYAFVCSWLFALTLQAALWWTVSSLPSGGC
jgi:hypothetical protein